MTFVTADPSTMPEPEGTNRQDVGTSPEPQPSPQLTLLQSATTTSRSKIVERVLPIPADVDPVLVRILSWCRPHDSSAEAYFLKYLNDEIRRRGGTPVERASNVVCIIPRTRVAEDGTLTTSTSDVLFSCHVDTVHVTGGKQNITYDPNLGHIFLEDKTANCLGADDGVGVWLMLEMISAKVPGTYVFHRGEERGAVGSNEMLRTEEKWLKDFRVAVAFDRPRCDEVITHQGGMRTCSDKFAQALAKALNDQCPHFEYAPSARGVFTDTKVYRRVIDECTNIGVGYENQHSRNETLNYAHAVLLRDAVCAVNWDALPVDRDSTKAEPDYDWRRSSKFAAYNANNWAAGMYGGLEDDNFFNRPLPRAPQYGKQNPKYPIPEFGKGKGGKGKKKHRPHAPSAAPYEPTLDSLAEIEGMSYEEIVEWVETAPDDAAALMIDLAAELVGEREKVKFLRGVKL